MEKNNWKPILLRSSDPQFTKNLNSLLSYEGYSLIDEYEHQVLELLKIRHLGDNLTTEDLKLKKVSWLQSQSFTVAVFPWLKKLVKLLNKNEFMEVRTNRNKLKITQQEQEILRDKTIGVIGMSVGRSVVTTLALEGVGGKFKLADYDTLDLSNLNRLKAPVTDLGLPKLVSVARELYAMNPYLELELFEDGITDENLDLFIHGNSPLDVLVEECDSLEVKIKARLAAREAKIPVIMETSDRGMLDIERFDLDPHRSIFHGKINESVWNETIKSKEGYQSMLFSLVDFPNLSERAKSSMKEIGKSISTWPQLGSAVVLGGGTVTHVARKILLGENIRSGRYYIDVDELIN